MSHPMDSGTLATSAKQTRYDRVIAVASEILSVSGEEAMQMRDLAQRADVSLATLYRYFPSKDYLFLAIAHRRYQGAARKIFAEAPQGSSVRERVEIYLTREFRAQERDRLLTAALYRVMTEATRSYSAMIEETEHLHLQIVRHVAAAGGALSDQQEKILRIVLDIFIAASRRWLSGAISSDEARFQIRVGCELVELPDDVVDSELDRATPDVVLGLP